MVSVARTPRIRRIFAVTASRSSSALSELIRTTMSYTPYTPCISSSTGSDPRAERISDIILSSEPSSELTSTYDVGTGAARGRSYFNGAPPAPK